MRGVLLPDAELAQGLKDAFRRAAIIAATKLSSSSIYVARLKDGTFPS